MSGGTGAGTHRIAVVGAGMAAARFAERYTALGGKGRVTLYGAEPRAPYSRVLLADVLTGRYAAADIALLTGGAELRTGTEVTAIGPGALTLDDGTRAPYDTLVVATGANPVLPPIRGLRGPDGELIGGVHSFRTVADCARLAADAARATRAVVIGGGVLGVSAARALAALGLPVEIVHQAPQLIERHLDEEAGAVLRTGLAALGVETYPGNRARALRGAHRVSGVELAGGYVLDADLVVLACGVRPRTGLARAAGLPVRAGVVVDGTLAVTGGTARGEPAAYAIGDCAEHDGTVHGLAAPAWEQADVLAARLSGADPDAVYTGTRPLSRLTAGPLEYAAFGDLTAEGPDVDVLRLADATRATYKKLLLRGDRLVGGVLVGDLATVGALTRAYLRDDPLPGSLAPLHLLTTQGAAR